MGQTLLGGVALVVLLAVLGGSRGEKVTDRGKAKLAEAKANVKPETQEETELRERGY